MSSVGRIAAALLADRRRRRLGRARPREKIPRHAVEWAGPRSARRPRPALHQRLARRPGGTSTTPRCCSAAPRSARPTSPVDPASPEICAAVRTGAQAAAAVLRRAPWPTSPRSRCGWGTARGCGCRRRCRTSWPTSIVGGAPSSWRWWAVTPKPATCSAVRPTTSCGDRASAPTSSPTCSWTLSGTSTAAKKGTPQRLLSALKATEHGRYLIAAEDYVLDVAMFQMEVLYRLMLGSSGPFNDTWRARCRLTAATGAPPNAANSPGRLRGLAAGGPGGPGTPAGPAGRGGVRVPAPGPGAGALSHAVGRCGNRSLEARNHPHPFFNGGRRDRLWTALQLLRSRQHGRV